MAKQKKQSVISKKVSFDVSNIESANTLNIKDETSFDEDRITHIRMLIPISHIERFQKIWNTFQYKLGTFAYSSPVKMFQAFTLSVHDIWVEEDKYVKPPSDFVDYITRKGKRPRIQGSDWEGEKDVFYISPKSIYYNMYVGLLYSFLMEKQDIMSRVYSVPYFFNDFMDIIESNMPRIIKRHQNNK